LALSPTGRITGVVVEILELVAGRGPASEPGLDLRRRTAGRGRDEIGEILEAVRPRIGVIRVVQSYPVRARARPEIDPETLVVEDPIGFDPVSRAPFWRKSFWFRACFPSPKPRSPPPRRCKRSC